MVTARARAPAMARVGGPAAGWGARRRGDLLRRSATRGAVASKPLRGPRERVLRHANGGDAVDSRRSAVDFHTALLSIFTALRSFPPAVRARFIPQCGPQAPHRGTTVRSSSPALRPRPVAEPRPVASNPLPMLPVPGTPGKTTTFFRRSHFILMKRGGEGVIAEKLLSGFLRCKLSFRIKLRIYLLRNEGRNRGVVTHTYRYESIRQPGPPGALLLNISVRCLE